MEVDDAPILRYLFRNFRPRRHLEFGTWQGFGTVLCLEECSATVWTINLPFGERNEQLEALRGHLYGNYPNELEALHDWARLVGLQELPHYQTDQLGFIGRHYLGRQLGHRVCQIYADSTKWDISNYPEGFFDTCLVDGGHFHEIVTNDTKKALCLLRSGGMILWHDFCPLPDVIAASETVRGVTRSIDMNFEYLHAQLRMLFWIDPSMILLGIKR
jgi:predicted O-methyltransferase YrrM